MEANTKRSQGLLCSKTQIANRISTYGAVSTELALFSDWRLLDLLSKATPIGTSIGGTAVSTEICGTRIFVKKIPLSEVEKMPENRLSTANIFGLPTYCQYGVGNIGSPGFGAWRELAAHTMSTNWVITGQCPGFPLMYHWRIRLVSLIKFYWDNQWKQQNVMLILCGSISSFMVKRVRHMLEIGNLGADTKRDPCLKDA